MNGECERSSFVEAWLSGQHGDLREKKRQDHQTVCGAVESVAWVEGMEATDGIAMRFHIRFTLVGFYPMANGQPRV